MPPPSSSFGRLALISLMMATLPPIPERDKASPLRYSEFPLRETNVSWKIGAEEGQELSRRVLVSWGMSL